MRQLLDDVEASVNVIEAQAVPLCAAEILSAPELRCRMHAALSARSTSIAIGK